MKNLHRHAEKPFPDSWRTHSGHPTFTDFFLPGRGLSDKKEGTENTGIPGERLLLLPPGDGFQECLVMRLKKHAENEEG
jgi:hypothetical protein